MTNSEAQDLIDWIQKNSNFKLTPKEASIIETILWFIKSGRKISSKQSWSLQNIYRRSTGVDKKLYSRILTK